MSAEHACIGQPSKCRGIGDLGTGLEQIRTSVPNVSRWGQQLASRDYLRSPGSALKSCFTNTDSCYLAEMPASLFVLVTFFPALRHVNL